MRKQRGRNLVRWFLLLVAVALVSCSGTEEVVRDVSPAMVDPSQALKPVRGWKTPDLTDDLTLSSLMDAVRASLDYYGKLNPKETLQFGPETRTVKDLQIALGKFLAIVEKNPNGNDRQDAILEVFDVFGGEGGDQQMVFTGYYEPVLYGSRLPGLDYTVPIYGVPMDMITADLGRFETRLRGIRIGGRYENGKLVPYYTRNQIDRLGALMGRGYEIAWVRDPVEAFFLHIQGSGRIILPDGTTIFVHFAANNGQPYKSIGSMLVKDGKIPAGEMSMQTLKAYLRGHPREQDSIMDANENYVFFEVVPKGPLGSLGVVLTAGRSIATDDQIYPRGALAYISTDIPELGPDGRPASWKTIGRFVLNQDTGGAIKGPGRADIFWGSGEEAGQAAGWMNRYGRMYFLVPKTN